MELRNYVRCISFTSDNSYHIELTSLYHDHPNSIEATVKMQVNILLTHGINLYYSHNT